MNNIKRIYQLLLEAYGRQGWWPVTPIGCRMDEYRPVYGVKGLTDKQRFEIIIGAILTQNTNWKNVEKALINLNKEKLIDINKIKNINIRKLASLIRPSGYFNQKAERLKIIADFLSKNPINKLKKGNIKELREKLLELKGIGPETADSILLYAFDKPIFVVDAYTKRVFNRLGYKEGTYEELQKLFMGNLSEDAKIFNEYHALLVELGKKYCKNKPICQECPIKNICKGQ